MINNDMRFYDYYTYGKAGSYGQQTLVKDENGEPKKIGSVKIAINNTSQAIQDSIKYKDCSYIGLTQDKTINDTFVIKYGNEKLKVMYVNPKGRFIQVFLKSI